MNKYPKIRVLFDRRHKSSDTTPGNIEIEVALDGRRKWISTGVRVLPVQWSGEVVNHPDAFSLNKRIEALQRTVNLHVDKLIISDQPFSFDGLSEALERGKHSGSFLDFVESRINERKDIREVTRTSHRSLIFALDRFKKIRTFEDITLDAIKGFDRWIKDQGYATTTVGKYHKFLKTYINEAKGMGLLEKNPYENFKVSKGKPKEIRYLLESELKRIAALELRDPSLIRARDLFMFQCYTGLAYIDLAGFDFRKVEDRDGRFIIRDARHKTGEQFYIVLIEPAMEILRKYNYVLPVISNQKYNYALKAFGVVLGKHITSHCGRHTFATMALNKGVPVEVVARMMGHSDIRATQIYARIIDKTVDNAFDLLTK